MGASQRRKGANEWRDVVSFAGRYVGRYQVSDAGDVRAHPDAAIGGMKPGRVLFQSKDSKGYAQVGLWLDRKATTVKVHRLVAEAFVEGYWPGLTINHIDGDKTNNCAENLEYVSNIENVRHAHRVIASRPAVVVNGERMSVTEAVERFAAPGVTAKAVRRRVGRLGWSIDKALSVPPQPAGRPRNGQIPA